MVLKLPSQLIDFKKTICPDHLLPVLQLSENGDAIFELKRIRLANDEPMAIETSYIPEAFRRFNKGTFNWLYI